MEKLYIVKIGSNIIDDAAQLQNFLSSFAELPVPKILVHGGGKLATELCTKLGIEPKMLDGRRITGEATLEVVTMVYGGLINKQIVAQLQAQGCNAIGITGADGNCIPAKKRPVKNGVDYGFVGDIDLQKMDGSSLKKLMNADFIPVVAPLTHNAEGLLLNTNADTIAASIAIALATEYEVELLYCFEKNGVLRDASDNDSLLEKISDTEYEMLKTEGIISAGMIPKLDNAFAALRMGVRSVYVTHARMLTNLVKRQNFIGTKLYDRNKHTA